MLSLRPDLVRRYADLLVLLQRHLGPDVVRRSGLLDEIQVETPGAALEDDDVDGGGRSLADDLEARGPAYVKFGQLLATRADLLPPALIEDLARLQDGLDPVPFEVVREVVEEELDVRLSKVFATFDEEPIATASLGQVHAATTRDGRAVAVKVQRPGIRERLEPDLAAFAELAAFVEEHTEVGRTYRVTQVVEQFRRSLARELDYRREARNLAALRANLEEHRRLVVPAPIDGLTTSRVLTMELVTGTKVTEVGPLRHLELDAEALLDELFRAYLEQVTIDGFVHADPHPGNILLTDDDRLALLDAGMVLRLEPTVREHLLRLVLAVSEHDTEQAGAAGVALSTPRPDADEDAFRGQLADLVGTYEDLPPTDVAIGTILLEAARIAGQCGYQPPTELTLLARTLLALDQVGAALAPDYDVDEAVRRHAGELLTRASARQLSPSRMLRPLLEAKEFSEELPARANRILGDLARGELRLKVDTMDEDRVLGAVQRVGNRLTAGIVLAALIVGAAMLMRYETQATLFGYPAVGLVFFVVAAVGGLVLAVTAFLDAR